jgi:4-amino-4-deoxy-L-arabinose transferase-like glycosyltransferase
MNDADTPRSDSRTLTDHRIWILAAVGLVLGIVAAASRSGDGPETLHGDQIGYHLRAVTLVEEGRYDGTYGAPSYPLLVASVYAVCGPRPWAVYLVQAVLFSAALVFLGKSALWITRDKTIARLAAALCVVYPPFYIDCIASLTTECLAVFLVALFVWSLLAVVETPSCGRCAAAGLALAALVYTRQMMLPFAGIVPVYLVWHHRAKAAGALRGAAVLAAVTALAILPWTYRNYTVTGRIVPISTGAGTNLWIGWWPPAYSESEDHPDCNPVWPHTPPELTAAIAGMSEVQRDDYLGKIAVSYIAEAPAAAAVNSLHKFSMLWLGNLGANVNVWPAGRHPLFRLGQFAIPAMAIGLVPIFLTAIAGYLLLPSEAKHRAMPVVLVLGWWTFAYVATVAVGRYALPVYPYILGFAAVALCAAFRRLVRPRQAP